MLIRGFLFIFLPFASRFSVVASGTSGVDHAINDSHVIVPHVNLLEWHYHGLELYFDVLLLLISICLFRTFYPKLPHFPEYVPQSLTLIVIGVIFGAIRFSGRKNTFQNTVWQLTPTVFFKFLLPPAVLDSSYALYNRTFVNYLGSILIYAVLGTVLCFLFIGGSMFGLDVAGAMEPGKPEITINSYFLFASMIVAVDPVAVLEIFQETGVNLGLYHMVFGESLLNDAVTIVLYSIMKEFINSVSVSSEDVGKGFASFFTISLGGLGVGIAFGVVSSILTRFKSEFSTLLLILLAYLSYILGDCLGWSGLISMVGCGLVQAAYAFNNISNDSRVALRQIVKQIAEVCESLIFFLIGISLFISDLRWSSGFCLWGIVICVIVRALVVLLLSWLINFFRINDMSISFREQFILVYGSLRGAVCLSLALLVEEQKLGPQGSEVKRIILTGTLFVILFTVGLLGTTMKPIVRLLHVKLYPGRNLSLFAISLEQILDHTLVGVESVVGSKGRNRVRSFITRIDDSFIRPLLQRDPVSHDEKIVKVHEKIALKLHYATICPKKSSLYLADLAQPLVRQYLSAREYSPDMFAKSDGVQQSEWSLGDGMLLSRSQEELDRELLQRTGGRRVSISPKWKDQEDFEDTFLGMMRRKSVCLQLKEDEEGKKELRKKSEAIQDDENIQKFYSKKYPKKDYPGFY
ncbi:unnamed protein product [Schistocephalus solidus]|uniref:Sodium/hydrogen exchanger n=1 Tax=Schistocephalus solidus TaxID=70667 RepID=A0A183TAS1_SCHSO|nr:unnamed protein product [Schistocephalus solidus]